MRAFLIPVGLLAVTIILEGCGGGGSSSQPCANSQPQLVSQSFDAKSSMHLKFSSSSLNTTQQAMDMNMTQKIDVDKVNLYFSLSTDIDMPDGKGDTSKVHMVEKVILNAEKKEAVMKVVFSGAAAPPMPNHCLKVSIPQMPSPAALSAMIKAAFTAVLGKEYKCTGNDGTYDTWDVYVTLPDPSIPIPAKYVTGNIKETLKMDKDFLVHSFVVTSSLQMNIPIGGNTTMATETEDVIMATNNAKIGGPSSDDLDYTSWGPCQEVHPANSTMAVHHVLSKSFSPYETYLPNMLSKSVHYRAIMKAVNDALHAKANEIIAV